MTAPNPPARPDQQPSLPEKVIIIDEALDEASIPHAFGGALALAYYAEPRATIDVDVNVFVATERWRDVVEALAPLGVDIGTLDSAALERDGQCRLWWGPNAVDLFFAYDPFHGEMREQSRRVPFAEARIPVLGPEHLAVCKAMFDRRKDWLDIEQMLIGADELQTVEVESWLTRMVGDDDRRSRRFGELVSRFRDLS